MKVETRTMHEPIGRTRTNETMSPDMQVMAPTIGDTNTIFFMSWRNWRADEAGLKRRAKMRTKTTLENVIGQVNHMARDYHD